MEKFERLTDRVSEEPDITDRDRKALHDLVGELRRRQDLSERRRSDILAQNIRLAREVPDITLGFHDSEKRDEVVDYIYANYEGWTSKDYRSAYRAFCRELEDGLTSVMEDVDAGLYNVEKRPHPDDFVTLDEAQEMIDAAANPRDRALVAIAFELGPRSGELYGLECRHVITNPETSAPIQLQFFGKTMEQRTVDMRIYANHVARWLTQHPGGGEDPLWTRLPQSGHTTQDDVGEAVVEKISEPAYLNVFKHLRKKAGLPGDLDVTPTNFRASNAYFLAGFPEMKLEDINVRQGRVPESDEIAHYLALRDSDVNESYAAALGEEVESERPSVDDYAPLTCPVCERDTPPDSDLCVHCGHALTDAGEEKRREVNAGLDEQLIEAEGREAGLEYLIKEYLRKNPEVAADIDVDEQD